VAGSTGQWRCSGASVVGQSHEREGLGCQDAWASYRTDSAAGAILAACVCDGAGSAKNAQAGAELVSRSIARRLAMYFDKALAEPADALFEAVFEVREAMGQRADQSQELLRDYACTLVAVAVRDDGHWVAWHLGDGGIIAQLSASTIVLSKPKKGDFANVTQFVSDADAYARVDCYSSLSCNDLGPPFGFALFTDGIEMSLFERTTGTVATAVDKMLNWHLLADEGKVSEAVRQNLQEVFRTLTGDDCTLVLLRFCDMALPGNSSSLSASGQSA